MERRGTELGYETNKLAEPNPNPTRKSCKIQLTPNISKLILKKIANDVLNSMEVVSSPNSTVCRK